MAFTVANVIDDRAREMMQDTVGPPTERWDDPLLISFLNDGIQMVIDNRPDSRLTAPYVLGAFVQPIISALADVVPLNDKYVDGLAEYVAGRAFGTDARDQQDKARADFHAEQFLIKTGMPLSLLTASRDQFREDERNQR